MKAVVIDHYGDSSVLKVSDRDIPQIKRTEVLIKVSAAGLNRADVSQRKGHYPAPSGTVQDILGLEVSGKVVAIGADVSQWQIGQEICALLPGGGYAEYVTVNSGSCLPIPKGISLEDAAALPEAFFTVWHNVFQRGRLSPHEDVFIYGGSGGVGSMAIQLVHLFGANAFTLASTKEKEKYGLFLGAQKVVNYNESSLLDEFHTESIDLILDSVGGRYLDINLELLRPEGRLVYINAMEGGSPRLDIFKIMQKRLYLTGSTLRSRSNTFKTRLAKEAFQQIFPLLENKAFKNMVRYRFPFKKASEAHQLMESRDFYGKIILCF